MARLTRQHSHDNDDEDEIPTRSAASTRQNANRRRQNIASLSPSPAASFSSDKENRGGAAKAARGSNGKTKEMAPPPKLPTPPSAGESTHANKRRRLTERDAPNTSQIASQEGLRSVADIDLYDPDQPMEERRTVRKGIRDLGRDLNGKASQQGVPHAPIVTHDLSIENRSEYLAANSTGIADTVNRANDLFSSVKQTADATLDSRVLVSAADLGVRRSRQLKIGETSHGIDVKEFIFKCISFMRKGPSDSEAAISGPSTQRRQRRRDESDDEGAPGADEDEGDAYNWEWLGRKACFPHNLRPPVSGFLLGPLSVQKKVRKQTQRTQRLQRQDPRDAIRPEELKHKDLEVVENSNLIALCKNIKALLDRTQEEGSAQVEAADTEGMTDYEWFKLLAKHNVTQDGGVCLFRFVINPKSFGQSIENLFYVSFLIRDGQAGVGEDSNKLLSLRKFSLLLPPSQRNRSSRCIDSTKPRTKEEIKEMGTKNHNKFQAIFHLDFPTWRDIVDAYEIEECVIPHRQTQEEMQVSATGWYG